MREFIITEADERNKLKILCIGVGSYESDVIDYLENKKIPGVELMVIDLEALKQSDTLKGILKGTDLVFIINTKGGYEETQLSSIIAKTVKESMSLSISIVSKGFRVKNVEQESDTTIVVSEKNMNYEIAEIVNAITGVIVSSGENDINIDIEDLSLITKGKGMTNVSVSECLGKDAAYVAMKDGINKPSMKAIFMDGAMGIIVHFKVHPDYQIMGLAEAMAIIDEHADEDADIIWGTTTDENLRQDYVKVTIITSKRDEKLKIAVNNVTFKEE